MTQESEQKSDQFILNVQKTAEISPDPEIQEALDWYKERLSALREMRVTPTTLTNGETWKAELGSNGEIDKVVGAHFRVEGAHVETHFTWDQPFIEQRFEKATSSDGQQVDISGIILLVKNQDKYLVTVENEPLADSRVVDGRETHPSVRTPVQTSVQKLKELTEGNEKVDPTLKTALSVLLSEGETFADVLRKVPLKKASTDPNRIHSNNYYGLIEIGNETAKSLEERTGGKFLSKRQILALDTVNGHTHVALSVNS